MAGIVELRLRADPAVRADAAVLPHRISLNVLLIPLIAVVQFVFTLALTSWSPAVNVFYRDVGNLARHVLRLWFYLSPALFSFEQLTAGRARALPGSGSSCCALNPWATCSRPTARPSTTGCRRPLLGRRSALVLAWPRSCCWRSRRCSSSASNPRSPRSSDGRRGRAPERGQSGARSPHRLARGHRRSRARRPVQPALHPQDDAPSLVRQPAPARAGRRDFWALRDVDFRLVHGESLGGHRAERRGQEHAPPGARRDHHAVGGRGRGRRPRLGAADLGAGFDQDLSGRDNIRAGRARSWASTTLMRRIDAGHHRLRRHRPVHRRPDQDVLVGHARPARLRDRDRGRPRHPPARRGPRDRRRDRSGRSRSSACWIWSSARRRSSW